MGPTYSKLSSTKNTKKWTELTQLKAHNAKVGSVNAQATNDIFSSLFGHNDSRHTDAYN